MENPCKAFVEKLQHYIDGDLPKKESMSLFLHVRDCKCCNDELEKMTTVFQALSSLPEVQAPKEFDEKILTSIPYESYKAMAEIRKTRVPVILEEEIIPQIVRAPLTRAICSVVAVLSAAGLISGWLDGSGVLLLIAGAMPEVLVRSQGFFRARFLDKAEHDAI
jgi:hypothetical protein